MKKFYSLVLALFIAATASSQLKTEVVSGGVLKITYGAQGNYAVYEPGVGTTTFYVHCWVNPADNTTGTTFEDSWANSTVSMTWDPTAGTAGAYVGTIDLNTKIFTYTNEKIPMGTTVKQVSMIFKDKQSGANNQSATLTAFGPTTVNALAVNNSTAKSKSAIIAGKLRTDQKGNLNISVYEMSGKLVRNFTAKANGEAIDLNVNKNGIYLVSFTNGSEREVVKFAK